MSSAAQSEQLLKEIEEETFEQEREETEESNPAADDVVKMHMDCYATGYNCFKGAVDMSQILMFGFPQISSSAVAFISFEFN